MGLMGVTEKILRSSLVKRLRPLVPGRFSHATSKLSQRIRDEVAYQAAMKGQRADCAAILERLKASYRPVTCPLVLISQAQRSGGSLLSQLFDSHSEILAHPHELKIGHPDKEVWPVIDPGLSADEQFRILFELPTIQMFEEGYAKGRQDPVRRNFFLVPHMQRDLFRHVVEQTGRSTPRQTLDAYFTSYFNCWLNLRADIARAKFVTGFVPMLVGSESGMEQYWSAYPDGYLICIVRSPLSWYPSAARLAGGQKINGIEVGTQWWRQSTQAIFREKQRHGERVIVLRFDDLVTNAEAVMRLICERLGIGFEPALLSPTFNGEPLSANTSFERMEQGAVSAAPIHRDKLLSKEDRRHLQEHCMPLYERALSEIVEPLRRV